MRRRLVIIASLVLVATAAVIAGRAASVIRLRPGPVRFQAVNWKGDRQPSHIRLDGAPRLGVVEVSEGMHQLSLFSFGDSPMQTERDLRVSGERATKVQEVNVFVWPWSLERARDLARDGWREARELSTTREVTANARWPDGGPAPDVTVRCGTIVVLTDDLGSARCGRMEGDVPVMLTRTGGSTSAATLSGAQSDLTLVVDPAPSP